MTHKLHIANTFLEWELETNPKLSLREAFYQHEIFLQLQFLPILFADLDDRVLITDSINSPRYFTLDDQIPSDFTIESWGYSQLIAKWADEKGLRYPMPDWEVVKEVNSKRFSFEHSRKLPGAALLFNTSDAEAWLKSFPGPKVLKTCFGVSGKGHLIIDENRERTEKFLQEEWNKDLPVIAEPWVIRDLDFSTQWYIHKDRKIDYLGATICQNDARGKYQSNTVGNLTISHLEQHKNEVTPILKTMAHKGYFGNVGIDAMVYHSQLHPVVEINARKTMGYAALYYQQKHHPSSTVRFSYTRANAGYLPNFLVLKNNRKVHFSRNLVIDITQSNK